MKFMKLAFLLMTTLCALAFSQVETGHYYLMSYFKNNYPGTGDMAGTFFATSTDAIIWTELNSGKPILLPAGLGEKRMRDPFIYFDATSQTFHLVYTTGWNTTNIGYTSIVPTNGKPFTDQNSWSPQVPLWVGDSVAGSVCCWAPEIIYDDIQNKFMIYLSIDVGVDGKRAYYFMTSDFKTYTKGKSSTYSSPMFFDPGFTEIDGDMLKVADHNYYFFFKDERVGYKKIYYVTGPTPQGPWDTTNLAKKSINSVMTGVEGPSSIKVGNEYRVFFDPYSARQNYRMVKSTDLLTWKDGGMIKTTADTTTYFDYSHCNVIEIPKNIYDWINSSSGALAVHQVPKSLSPVYSTGNRFEVPGVYDILGKKVVSNFSWPVQNAATLPAGFHVTVGKDKKVATNLDVQK
jgi:hypothetical protein